MSWTYEHHKQSRLIQVVMQGTSDNHDLHSLTTEIIQMEKDKGIKRILLDCTSMEFDASVSLIDIYKIPTRQFIEEGADRSVKLAVIHPESRAADQLINFFEMVCQNRGWLVEAFSDTDAAHEWLASGHNGRQAD